MKKISEVMEKSGVAFGTSGARGLVSNMTDEVCQAYTAAFIGVLRKNCKVDRIALGIDLRPSSPQIAAACAAAIKQQGLIVDYCGPLPTPALALYAMQQGIGAVMVTGSHIPFDRNGIKFYRPDGEISKGDEVAIAESPVHPMAEVTALPRPNQAVIERYIQRYLDFFPPAILRGLRLGLYEHSSVARDAFRSVLEGLGAEVVSLGRTDQFIPIDTEAVAEVDIQRGLDWSAQYKLDAIISTDGDGDRPLISDESGNWLRGDIVGLICARYLGVQHLAVPVSCNTAIELCGAFTSIARTRIGSPYVIAGMQSIQSATIAGFEANGGFLLGSGIDKDGKHLDPLPTRDAILPGIAVLAAAREIDAPVSSLLKHLPPRFTASDRIQAFATEKSHTLIRDMNSNETTLCKFMAPDGARPVSKNMTDGMRVTFDNGEIVHLRPSGNAPELRCYAEADNESRAKAITATTLAKIAAS